jgi:hypothetical protein
MTTHFRHKRYAAKWRHAALWQRPDAPNGEQRIVVKVSTTEADKLVATMYFINGGATTLVPSSAVTANRAGLKISFERINGAWEGRLSADGKRLDGTWTQDEPRPLMLTRATPRGEADVVLPTSESAGRQDERVSSTRRR